jgi:hypothetical protein
MAYAFQCDQEESAF